MNDKNFQDNQQQTNRDNNQASKDNPVAGSNTIKDPHDWSTGNEPMTGAQRSYLTTLSDEAGELLNENLTKAEASKRIDELQQINKSNNQVSKDDPVAGSNTIKDPDDWSTGNEPMTGAQRSYLTTLSDEAGEQPDENLTKAEASKRINELQQKTGRGLNNKT